MTFCPPASWARPSILMGDYGSEMQFNSITPSQQGTAFMYMDNHAQLSWSKHPIQLAHHASLRVNQLCTKARELGLRVDSNMTAVLHIFPPSLRPRRRSEAWQDRPHNDLNRDGEDALLSSCMAWSSSISVQLGLGLTAA